MKKVNINVNACVQRSMM